jgi:hypothetical protein
MVKMITPKECLVCRKHRGQITLAGGAIYEDELIFVSHAQLWGDEVDEWPEAPHGDEAEIERVSERIRQYFDMHFKPAD